MSAVQKQNDNPAAGNRLALPIGQRMAVAIVNWSDVTALAADLRPLAILAPRSPATTDQHDGATELKVRAMCVGLPGHWADLPCRRAHETQ